MSSTCSVRLCNRPSVNDCPFTCQRLCTEHFQAELSDLQKLESNVAQRIAYFKRYQKPLQQLEKRLNCDLELIDLRFRELRDTLDKCQGQLVTTITAHHSKLLESLKVVSELNEFENDVQAAKEQNDTREVYVLNHGMKVLLNTLQLDSKLVCIDAPTEHVRMVAFPDVNSRVKDLQACAEMQLTAARREIESLDVASSDSSEPSLRLEKQREDVKVNGRPVGMTLCSNTNGYVIDEFNCIAKVHENYSEGRMLPQPSIFVAVESSQSSLNSCWKNRFDSMEKECLNQLEGSTLDDEEDKNAMRQYFIDLISTDNQVSIRIPSRWDSSKPIRDLHCDSRHQKLFIAQTHAICATDISGTFCWEIAVSDLNDDAQKLHCIAGNSDHLFALTELAGGQKIIFGMSLETGETQIRIPFPEARKLRIHSQTRIATRDHMILVPDYHALLTVCSITGQLVRVESINKLNFVPNVPKFDSDEESTYGDTPGGETFVPKFDSDEESINSDDDGDDDLNIDKDTMLLFDHQPVSRMSAIMTYSMSTSARTLMIERSFEKCVLLMLEDGDLSLVCLKICQN